MVFYIRAGRCVFVEMCLIERGAIIKFRKIKRCIIVKLYFAKIRTISVIVIRIEGGVDIYVHS